MKTINLSLDFFLGCPCVKKNISLPLHHFKREEISRQKTQYLFFEIVKNRWFLPVSIETKTYADDFARN